MVEAQIDSGKKEGLTWVSPSLLGPMSVKLVAVSRVLRDPRGSGERQGRPWICCFYLVAGIDLLADFMDEGGASSECLIIMFCYHFSEYYRINFTTMDLGFCGIDKVLGHTNKFYQERILS